MRVLVTGHLGYIGTIPTPMLVPAVRRVDAYNRLPELGDRWSKQTS